MINEEVKNKLFEKMLYLEHMSELYCDGKTFDNVDYFAECNGAFEMLKILGLSSEYTNWAIGK